MSRRALLAAAAAVTAASLQGCVSLEKGRQLEARVQRLEVQNVEQQRMLDQTVKERVAKADQKIAEVQTKIDELNQVSRKSGANLAVELGKLQEDHTRVRGDLEAAQHRLDQLEKEIKGLETNTDARFAALQGAGALDDSPAQVGS